MTGRAFETAAGRTVEHGQFGGFPEVGDLAAERQLADVLAGAAAERLLDGAQDVSDGGLAQALVEGVLRYGTGCSARVSPVESQSCSNGHLRSGEGAPSATAHSHTAPEVKKWLAHKDPGAAGICTSPRPPAHGST
jgi:phosphoribosylformylglycinamidine (FGAM) synthase-like enzyme